MIVHIIPKQSIISHCNYHNWRNYYFNSFHKSFWPHPFFHWTNETNQVGRAQNKKRWTKERKKNRKHRQHQTKMIVMTMMKSLVSWWKWDAEWCVFLIHWKCFIVHCYFISINCTRLVLGYTMQSAYPLHVLFYTDTIVYKYKRESRTSKQSNK